MDVALVEGFCIDVFVADGDPVLFDEDLVDRCLVDEDVAEDEDGALFLAVLFAEDVTEVVWADDALFDEDLVGRDLVDLDVVDD